MESMQKGWDEIEIQEVKSTKTFREQLVKGLLKIGIQVLN